MGLIATDNGGGGQHFDPVSEGVHYAVCYGLFDLGTSYQEGMFAGDRHQVVIMWEVPGELIEVERDGRRVTLPRAISKRYTLSLNEKSNLRKDLQAWRGKAFTDDELRGFDLKNVLGKGCQLQIIHTTNQQGFVRAKIAAIMALPKGQSATPPANLLGYYSFADGGAVPESAPPWIVEEMKKSHEWKAMAGQQGATASTITEEDIPF